MPSVEHHRIEVRMRKQKSTLKNTPRVTVELDTVEFRDKAARAVRRLGYMTLSDFIREKMQQAIQEVGQQKA